MDVDRGMGEKKNSLMLTGIWHRIFFDVCCGICHEQRWQDDFVSEVGPGVFYTLLMDTLIGIGVGWLWFYYPNG
ncbi:MAG: hypothetical protein R3A45_01220 [Bdellovibrionota bacterium]